MPNARLTCIKPRTITRVFPFFKDKKARRPTNPEGLEELSLTSIVPLDFTEEVFKRIQASLRTDGTILHNHTEYIIEERDGQVSFCLGSKPVRHLDGILQDSASGELLYFLAIDNPDREIDTRQLDEGSQVSYDRTYRGVIDIKLYKGNIGHADSQEEKLKQLRDEVEKLRDDCSKEEHLTPTQQKLLQALEEGMFEAPIPIGEETVRYVEVTGVQEYL